MLNNYIVHLKLMQYVSNYTSVTKKKSLSCWEFPELRLKGRGQIPSKFPPDPPLALMKVSQVSSGSLAFVLYHRL